MNKTQLFAGVVGVLAAASAMAQGQFNFNNLTAVGGSRQLIYNQSGAAIAGANYLVDVLVKNPSTGTYQQVLKSGATFNGVAPLAGANAGLFSGNVLTVPFVAGGASADLLVRAWDVTSGASFDQALYKNSIKLTIAALGDPNAAPPTTPASIVNFASFALVPEPSTYALAALGLGGLLLFRRK